MQTSENRHHFKADQLKSHASEVTPLLGQNAEREDWSLLSSLYELSISCLGLLCTGANAVVMNLVLSVLIVPSPTLQGLLTSSSFVGQTVGQLVFGPVVDLVGPKVAGITTATLCIAGAAFAASAGTVMSLPSQLLLGRLVVGVAVGGEYPVSTTLCKIHVAQHFTQRQRLMCCMVLLTIGNLCMQVLNFILMTISIPHDLIWRILLAAAGLPSLACLFLRMGLELPTQVLSASRLPSRLPEDTHSERESYGSLLKTHFVEKCRSYIAALFASICAHCVVQVTGAYVHLFVSSTVGDKVDHQQLLWYDGAQALSQGVFLVLGSFSPYVIMRYMNIVWSQSLYFFVAATAILLAIVLCPQHPLLTLVIAAFAQAPQAAGLVTTYTIVGEMFPVEVVGTFQGIAGTAAGFASAVALFIFPILVGSRSFELGQLIECIVLVLGGMATFSISQLDLYSRQKGSSGNISSIVSVSS